MGDQTLRIRMELLAERLQAFSREHALMDHPGADETEWHRAQATAFAYAADLVGQELAKDGRQCLTQTKEARENA